MDTYRMFLAYYRDLGRNAIAQCPDAGLRFSPSEESNSIGVIVKHLHGNMRSRWTDFLTSDGEKVWRERDQEFEPTLMTREDIESHYDAGWRVVFDAVDPLTDADLERSIFIRSKPCTVREAILRQVAHYAYHVGQIVYLARWSAGDDWTSLSIPKGGSDTYNETARSNPHMKEHR